MIVSTAACGANSTAAPRDPPVSIVVKCLTIGFSLANTSFCFEKQIAESTKTDGGAMFRFAKALSTAERSPKNSQLQKQTTRVAQRPPGPSLLAIRAVEASKDHC
jgi:hypothetical protein